MNIKITDLLDGYYDHSVSLPTPIQGIPVDTIPKKQKNSVPQTALLIAASFLLLLCGGFILKLGLFSQEQGVALSPGEGDGLTPPVSVEEQVEESTAESVIEPSITETETSTIAPEISKDINSTYEMPSEDSLPHQLLTAELNLPVTIDGEIGTLERLVIDLTTGEYIWYYSIYSLWDMMLGVASEDTVMEALKNSVVQETQSQWYNAFLNEYWAESVLNFSDGSSLTLGSGNVFGYENGIFSDASDLTTPAAHHGIDLSATPPVSITVAGVEYFFDATTAMITDPTPEGDINSEPAKEPEVPEPIVESPIPGVIPSDGQTKLSPAQDVDGDGYLIAQLDLPIDDGDGNTGTLSRFSIDLSEGSYRWYFTITQLNDKVNFYNYTLEQYQANAYLMFQDGTQVLLGSGDVLGEENGEAWQEGRFSWLEGDYGLDLSNLEPAYLRIGETVYALS